MEIPKEMVVSMIESRFGGEQAQQAAQQLPDQVDTRSTPGCSTSSVLTRRRW